MFEALKDDSGRATPVAYFILIGAAMGFGVGSLVTAFADAKNQKHAIEHIQQYNAKLYPQLNSSFSDVHNLSLDTNDNFNFQATNKLGQTERCTGQYEVKNAVAAVSGNIACTISITTN